MLAFLAPAFLAALAVMAIPVLIHLTHRERDEVVEFPSIMFLQRIDVQVERRRRIRDWLLLAVRLAAIVLLVSAFARPFLDRGVAVAATGGAREVVLLLDRSYSMGHGDRWDRARDVAERVIGSLGAEDRATVVLFDETATAANAATSDRVMLRTAVDTARPGARATRYGPALKLAESVLRDSDLPRLEAVLVSDFQRAGWTGAEGIRLPAGAVLQPVAVGAPSSANRAVTGVRLHRDHVGGAERVTATARVVNRDTAAVPSLRLTLELDGREVQRREASLGAHDAVAVAFAPFVVPSSGVRATVRAEADALPLDDAFHFVAVQAAPVRMLLVEGPNVRPESSLYLRQALAIGDEPVFEVETVGSRALRASALAGVDVVVLNGAPLPGGGTGAALVRFVASGGGLLVVAGDGGPSGAGAGLLPGSMGGPRDTRPGAEVRLGYLDRGHPVFEPFARPRSGDFSAARFYRFRALDVAEDSTVSVVARFDDGTPALAERRLERGTVLALASSLDAFWNDLALQPVYLPFVHQLVLHLADFEPARAWHTAGDVLDLASLVESDDDAELLALSPSGARRAVDAGHPLELAEAGFYEIRRDGEPLALRAVNPDRSESDLAVFDPRELVVAVGGAGDATRPAAAATGPVDDETKERRQAVWWRLMLAAFALLAFESLLANRLSRPRAARI